MIKDDGTGDFVPFPEEVKPKKPRKKKAVPAPISEGVEPEDVAKGFSYRTRIKRLQDSERNFRPVTILNRIMKEYDGKKKPPPRAPHKLSPWAKFLEKEYSLRSKTEDITLADLMKNGDVKAKYREEKLGQGMHGGFLGMRKANKNLKKFILD